MHPFLLVVLALLTPFLLTLVLLAPLYAGVLGAVYVIYLPKHGGMHPLADRLDDVFYIIDAYGKLFDYWLSQYSQLSLVDYTLPIIGLPLAGAFIAFYGTYKLVRRMLNLFQLSASVN